MLETIVTIIVVVYAMGVAWAGARYADECEAGLRKATLRDFFKLVIAWPKYLGFL